MLRRHRVPVLNSALTGEMKVISESFAAGFDELDFSMASLDAAQRVFDHDDGGLSRYRIAVYAGEVIVRVSTVAGWGQKARPRPSRSVLVFGVWSVSPFDLAHRVQFGEPGSFWTDLRARPRTDEPLTLRAACEACAELATDTNLMDGGPDYASAHHYPMAPIVVTGAAAQAEFLRRIAERRWHRRALREAADGLLSRIGPGFDHPMRHRRS